MCFKSWLYYHKTLISRDFVLQGEFSVCPSSSVWFFSLKTLYRPLGMSSPSIKVLTKSRKIQHFQASAQLCCGSHGPREKGCLHLTSCISPPASHLLHPTSCISPPASHLLHLTSCISPVSSHLLHLTSCIPTSPIHVSPYCLLTGNPKMPCQSSLTDVTHT